jgi:signal transduction histidine kinase/ActR/RegA family two-component response regulator
VAFAVISGTLLALGRRYFYDLHSVLDTGIFLTSGISALLLWDMAVRMTRPLLRWMAISLAVTSMLEFVHVLVGLNWSDAFASITASAKVLRPTTWPPAAYLLPAGIACSLWLTPRDGLRTTGFAFALVVFGAAFHPLFYWLPQYTVPVWFGITRPTLIFVPVLWGSIAWICWRRRRADRIFPILLLMALVMLVGSLSMLYSNSPHDTQAMVAHLGKIGGYLALLLSIMHMASSDMLERIRAERQLAQLNEELERRVLERTTQLELSNQSLAAEVVVRQQAERKAHVQLERLYLLHQITRAIGERQDLQSIYQVMIRRLEDDLPIDFCCVCRYDPDEQVLTVTSVGVHSGSLAKELAMTEQARVPIDQNGLSRCVRGELVYEAEIVDLPFPFPRRLATGGLRSLVAAPLVAESQVFGVLIAARRQADSFSSSDCEFLRQLSEHAALAAHQAQLYSSLQQAYDDLRRSQQTVLQQERLRSLGQMASGVAHDINNALSPVALYTESLLEQESSLSDRARSYLATIQRAIDDVAHTVSRMREFYRPQQPELSLLRIDLNHIVDQVLDLTRVRWRDIPQEYGAVIDLRTELQPELSSITGAEHEIRDALTNLIFNAVDAMPNGGTLTISTRTVASTGMNVSNTAATVHLEVSDTGVGMDEETQRRCLEPFYTTKGERGTGLGLAMVYGMVQRHSAEIEIDSAPNKGTTLRLIFPVAASETTLRDQQVKQALPIQPLRILIVDDDPLIIESLRNTLQNDGHRVTAADGGQMGIDAFLAANNHNEPFAVVITDLGMPYIDGRKVAAAVKVASPATPVVLLTGWGQRLISDNEIPAHVDRVLNKPPRLRDLRAVLAEFV